MVMKLTTYILKMTLLMDSNSTLIYLIVVVMGCYFKPWLIKSEYLVIRAY